MMREMHVFVKTICSKRSRAVESLKPRWKDDKWMKLLLEGFYFIYFFVAVDRENWQPAGDREWGLMLYLITEYGGGRPDVLT